MQHLDETHIGLISLCFILSCQELKIYKISMYEHVLAQILSISVACHNVLEMLS